MLRLHGQDGGVALIATLIAQLTEQTLDRSSSLDPNDCQKRPHPTGWSAKRPESKTIA